MSYFRSLDNQITTLLELLSRDERWLIMFNADPDALASAMALRRIMIHRVADVAITHVNDISRPDNLAMISYLRIPTRKFTPNLAAQYDRFALVDSQPHHHPAFKNISFSIIFDHHPIIEEEPALADFKDVKPEYGACATLMTEYLYTMKIRPGKLLATALLYGIQADTQNFFRKFHDVDVRAFRYLTKISDPHLLRKVVNSEFRIGWLNYFSQAFVKMRLVRNGLYVFIDDVENPDVLVLLADFFMRVQEINWTVVCGVYKHTLVVIFRGDGRSHDVGRIATQLFGDLGSAGGHKAMARAEVPLEKLGGKRPESFVWQKLNRGPTRIPKKVPPAPPTPPTPPTAPENS